TFIILSYGTTTFLANLYCVKVSFVYLGQYKNRHVQILLLSDIKILYYKVVSLIYCMLYIQLSIFCILLTDEAKIFKYSNNYASYNLTTIYNYSYIKLPEDRTSRVESINASTSRSLWASENAPIFKGKKNIPWFDINAN